MQISMIMDRKTLFREKQNAIELARAVQSDDNEWTYTAERFAYMWVVAVYDESVRFVAYL